MMNNSGPAVAVSGLQVVRGKRRVIPGLDLEIPAGQVVGLLGPSGSGKSTLMRCIVGVQIIESGTVTVLGHPAGSPVLRDRVGYVTQSPSVYADLSVRDNVVYFGRAVGLRGAELREAVDRTLAEVDLVLLRRPARPGPLGRPGVTRLARRRARRPPEPARPRRADRRPRPGAAPRPVGPLPPPRRTRALARRVEPRHGRGHPLRPARPAARGSRPRRRHPRRAARSRPGAVDADAAFLALIDAETARSGERSAS